MIKKKLLVIGDNGSGRRSLLMAFIKKRKFLAEEYRPSNIDIFERTFIWNQKLIALVSHNIAGQEDYDRLRPLSYADTDIIVICYGVDCVDSDINVRKKWAKEAHHFCKNKPIILVGTKVDLRNDNRASNPSLTTDVFVSESDGQKLADKIGADYFMECSARNFTNVMELFEKAVELSMQNHKRKPRLKHCYLL